MSKKNIEFKIRYKTETFKNSVKQELFVLCEFFLPSKVMFFSELRFKIKCKFVEANKKNEKSFSNRII